MRRVLCQLPATSSLLPHPQVPGEPGPEPGQERHQQSLQDLVQVFQLEKGGWREASQCEQITALELPRGSVRGGAGGEEVSGEEGEQLRVGEIDFKGVVD